VSQTAIEAAEARPRLAGRDLVERALGLGLVAIVGLWLLTQAVQTPQRFAEALVTGLNYGAVYALIALGYTMVYGIIELINFSHGDLFMLGNVLAATILITAFGATSASLGAFAVLVGGMIVVMIGTAAVNVGAERFAYRRLRRAPKLAPLITAVGLSFVYQWGGVRANGSGQRTWDNILGSSGFTVLGVKIPWSSILVACVTIPLLVLMMWVVQRTRQGKAMRATAQDQDAARLMGIDVDRTIAFTFGMGGALAGAASVLWLQTVPNTRWDAGFKLGLIAFTAAVLGGIGRLDGAVLGGVLIGVIENLNESGMLPFGQKWSATVVFGILILLMVFKPQGLLGKATTEKV
jgi:branched-chain amino acid transport system permease protein